LFTLIALFAVANTGLLNFIMGSRLIYGMSRQGLLALEQIEPVRRKVNTTLFADFSADEMEIASQFLHRLLVKLWHQEG